MTDRIGQIVRFILIGNRFYSGTILSEDDHLIVICDKFGKNVTLGKASIISMEELN